MNETAPEPVYLSIEAAAEKVGVSRRTIYNWYAAGRLKTKRTAGNSLRIEESSLWRPGKPDPA